MHTITDTLEFARSSLDVEIDYEATPGERRVDYYPDGSGYPGSPPDAELIRVRVVRWDVGAERRQRGASWVWSCLDLIAGQLIERDWDNYREACLADRGSEERT